MRNDLEIKKIFWRFQQWDLNSRESYAVSMFAPNVTSFCFNYLRFEHAGGFLLIHQSINPPQNPQSLQN